MKSKGKSTQVLTFWINDDKRWVNVEATVEEFDDGQLIISTACKNECIGKRETSVDNYNIVSTYGGGA